MEEQNYQTMYLAYGKGDEYQEYALIQVSTTGTEIRHVTVGLWHVGKEGDYNLEHSINQWKRLYASFSPREALLETLFHSAFIQGAFNRVRRRGI